MKRLKSKIRFLPRNDGNSIYEGHTYSLFCWNWQKWNMINEQKDLNHHLYYSVPANVIFYKMLQHKKRETVFYFEDGEQNGNKKSKG